MKVLLTAVNAKYIHTNLAIYCLRSYAKKYKKNIELAEFTINNYVDDILQEIYKKKPDIVMFSCYIWNIEMIKETAAELRKVLPDTKIWLGGPEVSYDAKDMLLKYDYLDGIMVGEGEATFLELMDYFIGHIGTMENISGIVWKDSNIHCNAPRQELNLSSIPFPYENIEDLDNKIIYYETSRGCPYSCSYCLSSIDEKLRFRDTELVKEELAFFLEQKVPQVKFVDRTFNCKKDHAIAIWTYIRDNDNGITNFHFEISADLIKDAELELLKTMRPGLIQLEIGVQSTNPSTIDAINRRMDFGILSRVVNDIKQFDNIHQHLDLIAGLPYEDVESFRQSFEDVYALKPDQLQLGFLKVLKGSGMFLDSVIYGIVYKDKPPYEVLSTDWISYQDVLRLKQVEEMVEVYYNSGQFTNSIAFMEHSFDGAFDMYDSLGRFYERMGWHLRNHTRIGRYENLLSFYIDTLKRKGISSDFVEKYTKVFSGVLTHDLYLRENAKSRPVFASDSMDYKDVYRGFYEKEKENGCLNAYADYNSGQISRMVHIEHYNYDIQETAMSGELIEKEIFILYDYKVRNPLNHEAKTVIIQNEEMMNHYNQKKGAKNGG